VSGALVWLRAIWKPVLILFLGVQTFAMLNVAGSDDTQLPAWSLDWSWMLSVWSGATLLLSPAAAAVAAFLMHRSWSAATQDVVSTLRRGRRPQLQIMMAVFLLGLVVQLVWLAIGAALCLYKQGDSYGLTLPWQLTTGPAALLAGTATGAAVGCLWRGNWAPPVVGITMFLSQRVFFWEGYPELWVIEQATWMMTGARPKANHLIATTTVNLLAFVAGAVAVWWQGGVRRFRGHWRLLIVAACIVGIVLVFMPFVISGDLDTYERIR